MSNGQPFVFYTYSIVLPEKDLVRTTQENQWDEFFDNLEDARAAVSELFQDLVETGTAEPLLPVRIERIETASPTKPNILALLNGGASAFVRKREVMEIMPHNQEPST